MYDTSNSEDQLATEMNHELESGVVQSKVNRYSYLAFLCEERMRMALCSLGLLSGGPWSSGAH